MKECDNSTRKIHKTDKCIQTRDQKFRGKRLNFRALCKGEDNTELDLKKEACEEVR